MSSVKLIESALAPHAGTLHAVARTAIREGLGCGVPTIAPLQDHPEPLQARMASFVTLRREGELRGCVGSAEAVRPLLHNVAHNAFGAAFRDSRFPPVRGPELGDISIEVSVLRPLEALRFIGERDLLAQLLPARHGLCLELGDRRGLFLPQVWEMVPDAWAFLGHLKAKAGLPSWPLDASVSAYRFETIKFGERAEIGPDLDPVTM